MKIKTLFVGFILIFLLLSAKDTYSIRHTMGKPTLLGKAEYYKSRFVFDSAAFCFNQAYMQAMSGKDYDGANKALLELSLMYYEARTNHLAMQQLASVDVISQKHHLLQTENYAIYCDIIGKIYFDASAPEKAHSAWEQSLSIRKKLYPANDIRLVRSYVNFLIYYFILMDYENNVKTIKIVTSLLEKNNHQLDSIDLPEVYDALANSIKYSSDEQENQLREDLYKKAQEYLLSAIQYVLHHPPVDYYILGRLYHTFANTNFDNLGYSKFNHFPVSEQKFVFQQAALYYDLAAESYKHIFKDRNGNISRSYFVRAMLSSRNFQDSELVAAKWFRKSIESAMPIDNAADIIESTSDKPDLLQMFRYYIESTWNLYQKTKEMKYLEEAYMYSTKALAIWEKLMYDIQSNEKTRTLNRYGLSPLQYAAGLANSMYKKTQNPQYAEIFFKLSEKSKYYTLQKNTQQENINVINAQQGDTIIYYQKLLKMRDVLLDRQMMSYYCNNTKLMQKQTDSLRGMKTIIKNLEEVLQEKYADYYSAYCKIKTDDIARIQQKMPDSKTAIIEYFILADYAGGYTVSFTITRDTFFISHISLNIKEMTSHCQDFLKSVQCSNYDSYIKEASFLYKSLVLPSVKAMQGIKKLIFIPDPAMSYIPFDAMISDTLIDNPTKDYRKLNYLIRDYSISSQLSYSLFDYLSDSRRVSKSGEMLVASPEFNNGKWANLPFSVQAIKTMPLDFHGKFLTGKLANKSEFIRNASDKSVIQISTHSSVDIINSGESKLYFSQYSNGDSNNCLKPEDIYNNRLKADLVVLNACETNKGENELGEGIIGFPRAFLIKGSKSVLSTLWKTDDEKNANLILSFYYEFRRSASKSEALRNVKLNYLSEAKNSDEANPLYWAGLVIYGNDETFDLSKSNYEGILLISAGGLLLFAFAGQRILRKKKSI